MPGPPDSFEPKPKGPPKAAGPKSKPPRDKGRNAKYAAISSEIEELQRANAQLTRQLDDVLRRGVAAELARMMIERRRGPKSVHPALTSLNSQGLSRWSPLPQKRPKVLATYERALSVGRSRRAVSAAE
jgi:hypothetical protein